MRLMTVCPTVWMNRVTDLKSRYEVTEVRLLLFIHEIVEFPSVADKPFTTYCTDNCSMRGKDYAI